MNILFIRIGGFISGAEIYNINLIKKLCEDKGNSIFFLTNLPEMNKRISRLGAKSFIIDPQISEIGTKKDFLKAFFLRKKITKEYLKKLTEINDQQKIDLILLESMTEKIFLTKLLKKNGYKVIWIEHGPLFRTNRSWIIKFFYKYFSKSVDKIIAVSEDTKNDLITAGISYEKVSTNPIGLDKNYYIRNEISREKTRSNHCTQNMICVGYVGNINREKGIERFIEVAKNILKINSNYFFIIVGDGPLLQSVKKITLKYKKHFLFTGGINDVKKYLEIMDLFLLPTEHYEGISLAILEAMYFELCVITKDIGGNRELIVNNKSGFLYKEFNVLNIVNLIEAIVKNNSFRRYGKNARKIAISKFNINNSIKKFYEIINNI